MSWCGGGEMSPTPGVLWRIRPTYSSTLCAGKLPTFAGLGALGHLDLQLVCVDEIFGGDAEPAAGDLLDRADRRSTGLPSGPITGSPFLS